MKPSLGLLATMALTGCVTSQIPPEFATPVPAERLYGYGQKVSVDDATIIVIGDRGLYGSGCGLVVRIDGQRGAMLNAGEISTLYASDGEHLINVDVSGEGLCAGMSDKVIEVNLQPSQGRVYRVSADQTGFQISPYVLSQ